MKLNGSSCDQDGVFEGYQRVRPGHVVVAAGCFGFSEAEHVNANAVGVDSTVGVDALVSPVGELYGSENAVMSDVAKVRSRSVRFSNCIVHDRNLLGESSVRDRMFEVPNNRNHNTDGGTAKRRIFPPEANNDGQSATEEHGGSSRGGAEEGDCQTDGGGGQEALGDSSSFSRLVLGVCCRTCQR